MRNRGGFLLLFVMLGISVLLFADWHVEYSSEANPEKGLVLQISKKAVRISDRVRSVVYFPLSDSLRYESKMLRCYWEGSYEEFFAIRENIYGRDETPVKSKNNRLIIKKGDDKESVIGYKCDVYNVFYDTLKIKTVFRYNNNFDDLIGQSNKVLSYLAENVFGDCYGKEGTSLFDKRGILMKVKGAKGHKCDFEAIMADSAAIDPSVFNVPDNFRLLNLEEILSGEKYEEKTNKQ